MKVLFVNSGASGFHARYAFDIYDTLQNDLGYHTKQVSPQELTHSLINSFKPDILLVVHGTRTPLNLVRYAKSNGTTTVLWLVEDPYEIDFHRGSMALSYDFVFTNERQAVQEYNHPKVFYLPWCCNPRVHRRLKVPSCYESDICFVGMGFANRINILNAVAPFLKRFDIKLIGDWERWGGELDPELRGFCMPVIDNFQEIQKYYNGAKINLNLHRDPIDPPSGNRLGIPATSPNDRTFALGGCGVFQLVDNTRPDLWDAYIDGEEIVSFKEPDDLAEKMEFFLLNPDKREKIGRAGQIKSYQRHTFRHRLNEIFQTVRQFGLPFVQQNTRQKYGYNLYKTYHTTQNSPVYRSK